jgi:preprotein translocase subunit SecE
MKYGMYIWIGLVALAFVYLWRNGQLMRLRAYCEETWEELKKCAWPTWAELKGSTMVVMVSMLLLGLFTVAVDIVFGLLMRLAT